MRFLWQYLSPRKMRMAGGMAIKFLGTAVELMLPYILAHVIDVVTPTGNLPMVIIWGIAMLICSGAALAGNIIANRMAAAVARDTAGQIRYDLFVKIAYLTNRQMDRFTMPSLITRMTTDTYNIHRMIGMMQRGGVRAPILILGGIAITMTLDPVLSAVLSAMLPLMFVVVFFVSRKGIPLFGKLQQTADSMLRVVRENITGVRVIRSLSRENYEKGRFREVNERVVRDETKASGVMASINPAMNFMLNMGLVLVVLVGANRVNSGLTDVGKIIAFLSYFTIILNAILMVTRILTMFTRALASAGRIEEVMLAESEMPVLEAGGKAVPEKDTPHIEFRDVCFSYDKKEENLSGIRFSLRQGESLGILGPTGAGKSTIVQLLLRFYDIDSGGIYIDGQDIRTLDPAVLRRKFGVVFQNDVVFRDSVRDNISIGREIGDSAVEWAAENAQAAQFIEAAGGFDYQLEAKGANLSGGQKQRILIARALAGQPEILILDDSSSALDYKTDAALRSAIRTQLSGTTSIIIAQRISSVMHCDRILVLEDGRELGCGTHSELMRDCELYREISRLQMETEAEEVQVRG